MEIYTEMNKRVYLMGAIDAILKTPSNELSVESIKNILKGAKEVVDKR